MTDNTQPEAGSTHIIRFALELGLLWIDGSGRDKVREALDALDALEAQLEAIGAGGVSGPLVGRAAPPTAQALGCGTEPPGIQALMCVISSLRDIAHFSDEEGGELMSALCALRDWAYAQTAAFQLPPTSAEGVEHG